MLETTATPSTDLQVAKSRLRLVSRADLSIERRKCGTGFTYIDEEHNALADADRARIEALAIPPRLDGGQDRAEPTRSLTGHRT